MRSWMATRWRQVVASKEKPNKIELNIYKIAGCMQHAFDIFVNIRDGMAREAVVSPSGSEQELP